MGKLLRGGILKFKSVGVLAVLFFSQLTLANQFIAAALMPALFGVTSREVNDDYAKELGLDPSVTVPLVFEVDGELASCTTQFVSPEKAITAGHCVNTDYSDGGAMNVDGIYAESAVVHPAYLVSKLTGGKDPRHDLAVVTFPKGTGTRLGIKSYPKLAASPLDLEVDSQVWLVGYGMGYGKDAGNALGKDQGSGVRGWGVSQIEAQEDGALRSRTLVLKKKTTKDPRGRNRTGFEPEGDLISIALPGDSGGAVYNRDGEISGVVSIVASLDETESVGGLLGLLGVRTVKERDMSNGFCDITEESNAEFLAENLECEGKCGEVALKEKETASKEEVLSALESLQKFASTPYTPGTEIATAKKLVESGAKIATRTGLYTSEDSSEKRLVFAMHGPGGLASLSYREKQDDGELGPVHVFSACAQEQCLNLQDNEFALIEKSGEVRFGNFRKGKEAYTVTFNKKEGKVFRFEKR